MLFLQHNLDFLVFGILGLMSFIMLWLVIERYFYYRHIKIEQFDNSDALHLALTHNLTFIATVGSNAPYIGLLGTVIGIMLTFYDMGQSGNISVQTIMTGLALALRSTAGGILVALPAVMFYNALLRKVNVVMTEWKVRQA
jgi:biopolymer transport protein ExbB